MATKKSGPTLASLNAQIATLQSQTEAFRKKEVAEVIAKVNDAIAQYGLTAADLGLGEAAPNVKYRKLHVDWSSARAAK